MVGRWGMSDNDRADRGARRATATGRCFPGASETSPQTQQLVDEEVRRLVDEAHDEVTRLLTEHREQLESLAQALLEAETLDAPDAYKAAGVEMRPVELAPQAEVEAAAQGV